MLRVIIICAGLAVSAFPVTASEADLIEFLRDELVDLRADINELEAAPEEGGLLTKGKADRQADIDALLDKAIEYVSPDTFSVYVKQIDQISTARQEAEAMRAELLLKRIEAKTSEGVGMVGKALGRKFERGSLEDIEQRITDINASLSQLDRDKEAITVAFAQDMNEKHGVMLSNQQAQAILYSVNGEILIDATVVLSALTEVERRLAEVMSQKVGAEAQRDYIGVASATRLIHARLLQRHLDQYDNWLPELTGMREETQRLLAQTKTDAARASQESVRMTYANNIRLQERILTVIDKYSDMLMRRRQLTADALALAEERAAAAINTLQTLDTAAGLSAIIANSTADYDKIIEIQLPEMEQFDPADFDEMLDISRKLTS